MQRRNWDCPGKRSLWALIAFGVLPLMTTLLLSYGSGPRPRHTGGFQEETCTSCHDSFRLNEGRVLGGQFSIEGVPERYEPGRAYPLVVEIAHPGQVRWGFQLSSRFQSTGRQAGTLQSDGPWTQVKTADRIQYIEHTDEGSREGDSDGPIRFEFTWTAPTVPESPVLFNAAGNAADGSWDPKGDYIYTASRFSRPESQGEDRQELTAAPATEPARRNRLNVASRLMHIPAPRDLQAGNLEIHIEHRFFRAIEDSSPGNAFGLDSPANINLGLNYALTDRLSAGVSRARFDKIVAFTGTYELMTEETSPWKLALLGGLQGRDNFQEHYSPFFQLAGSWDYELFRFYAAPTVILNSRADGEVLPRRNPINPEDNHTFSLGLGVDAALFPRLSLTTEFVPRLSGFGGFGAEHPAISAGFKVRSWGHVFTVIFSTSNTFTPAEYAVNTRKDFSIGFNIYRRID